MHHYRANAIWTFHFSNETPCNKKFSKKYTALLCFTQMYSKIATENVTKIRKILKYFYWCFSPNYTIWKNYLRMINPDNLSHWKCNRNIENFRFPWKIQFSRPLAAWFNKNFKKFVSPSKPIYQDSSHKKCTKNLAMKLRFLSKCNS